MNKWIKAVIYLILFLLFLGMVVTGQKTVGPGYLAIQIIGILGLVGLLYSYNKKYQ